MPISARALAIESKSTMPCKAASYSRISGQAGMEEILLPFTKFPSIQELAKLIQYEKAFENTSTSVAASQMRNALNNLADTVTNEAEKKHFEIEMDNFFALFRRYLNDKARGNTL